ncbi:hypothetical protein BH11CYA1_BH11CYA1_49560 [soil metagenome]
MFQEVAENPAPNQASPEAGSRPADYQARRISPEGGANGANAKLVESGLLPSLSLSGSETIEPPGVFRGPNNVVRVVGTKVFLSGEAIIAGQNSDVAAMGSSITANGNAIVTALNSRVNAHDSSKVFAGLGSGFPAHLPLPGIYDARDALRYNSNGSAVTADESATVVAFEGSSVDASGNARVEAQLANVRVVDFATAKVQRSYVIAGGDSIVSADDRSSVTAWDRAIVIASNGTSVEAQRRSQVVANNDTLIVASDTARVIALPGSLIRAGGDSTVQAHLGSVVLATENSQTIAEAGSFVVARRNARVRARPGSNVLAEDGANVRADAGANVTAQRGALVEAELGANVAREGFLTYWDPRRPGRIDPDSFRKHVDDRGAYAVYWGGVQRDWFRKACQTTASDSRADLQGLSVAAGRVRTDIAHELFERDRSFSMALIRSGCY